MLPFHPLWRKVFAPRQMFLLLLIICGLVSSAGAGLPPAAFASPPSADLAGGGEFSPLRYFAGTSHSWGVFEDPQGRPLRRFAALNRGEIRRGVLQLQQVFHFEDGTRQIRRWTIRQTGPHRFEGAANDVVGLAQGVAYGNAFRWEYTLRLPKPIGPIRTVRLRQWLYLQEDRSTLQQRATVRKLGIVVGGISETIFRDRSLER